MKNIIFILVNLLLFSFASFSQDRIDWSQINTDSILWDDVEIYKMTEKFQIQDTFFSSQYNLKLRHSILRYIPQPEFDNYCAYIKKSGRIKYDMVNYEHELNEIQSIDKWVKLLAKYPYVGEIFARDTVLLNGGTFSDFIHKAKVREILLFVDNEHDGIIIVPNTRSNYNQYKHLTRLK